MKSMQPKIGDTLWGVWEHRYYNEKRLVEYSSRRILVTSVMS